MTTITAQMTTAQAARLTLVLADAPDVTHQVTDDGYVIVTEIADGKTYAAAIYPNGDIHC